jgi:UDP-N-acetylmuramoyl-L-alanyl-D-glutamate--2,6-diaminopimelate ligase
MPPCSLSTLFTEFPFYHTNDFGEDPTIAGITADSRKVQPGNVFVAMSGGSSDGHLHIADAVARGAAALVGEKTLDGLTVPYIRVDNSRQALAYLAAAFYGYPARKLTMIGVTGTDGKTTTCNILYQILLAAGRKTGMISTVNAVIADEVLDTGFHVTTPDAPDVQYYLAKMVAAGLTHVVLETTSHGWAQYRVDACEFDLAVVTNITHEHLDYHGSYENYRAAKARLFTSLASTLPKPQGNPRLAVLNRDDDSYSYLSNLALDRKISYGLGGDGEVCAENIRFSPDGTQFVLVARNMRVAIKTDLVGAYNVSNCLAALAVAVIGLGISPEVAARGISQLRGVPGRMERIESGQPYNAIVDFAHTPNALRVSLETARTMLALQADSDRKGRLIAVFGSAGLRDKEKRRMMADISARLADITIFTAEDPRTESLDKILEEMADGARAAGGLEEKTFWRVRDRGAAISFALANAQSGDFVIVCGKGHEQSMCFGTTEYLWDDRTAMRAALAKVLGQDGPEMPYLPTSEPGWGVGDLQPVL